MDTTAMERKMREGQGFIAALDQSGGSTPKALKLYGVAEDAYGNDAEMFDLIHQMRERIVTAPAFTGEKVIGAILFEQTMDRDFGGISAPKFLWENRGVVPFLKVDKGLEETAQGVQLMKPIEKLDTLLARAREKGIFGTKMRSVIHEADEAGIEQIVAQQFAVGRQILRHGLVPILEPEINIKMADKARAEELLTAAILKELDVLPDDQKIMLKLTLPEASNCYEKLVDHPQVLRVVALSGGYTRDEANDRLSQNRGVIASFSRALTEGLSADQDDVAFDDQLAQTIDSIHKASVAG